MKRKIWLCILSLTFALPGCSAFQNNTYGELYLPVVEESPEDAQFSFIYLDEDDIPELVCYTDFEGYSVYTIKEGEAWCQVHSLYTVELTYFQKKGILAAFDRWNGGGDEGGYGKSFYALSKNETLNAREAPPTLQYIYNAVYDAEGNYTGEGVVDYYSMGERYQEENYRELMGSLEIGDGDDILCMENEFTREEMLKRLALLMNWNLKKFNDLFRDLVRKMWYSITRNMEIGLWKGIVL